MAWRIHDRVLKGEMDNRERGCVRGRIWLVGCHEPVMLELSGNCRRDLAGCLVTFANPRPIAPADPPPGSLSPLLRSGVKRGRDQQGSDIAMEQTGVAGDITASRKVRVFDVPLEEALGTIREGGTPPEHMANSLYIEWFSDTNGRVVIESSDYTVTVSPAAWALSPEEEQDQVEASHQAMRDWLERLDQAPQSDEPAIFDPADEKPLDEFGYEKVMRESDERTDKYMELLEKYEGHPDQEKIVAREMGWEWLEEALEADERGALPPRDEQEVPPLVPNPATQGVDWIRDEEGHIHHPLSKRTFESAMSMWHFCDDTNLLGENGDTDLHEMIFQYQTSGAKIAGALDSLAYDDDESSRDSGFVVAALKRALNYLHKSIAAAERVAEKNLLPRERLESFRADLFEVREEMLRLMQHFRGKGS
jgi:hypothetical protein